MSNNYPYPKLQKNSDDYLSIINCDISCSDSGIHLVIRGKFELIDEELNALIEEGNANFCILIVCSATNSKKLVKIPQKFMYKLVKSEFADKIVITPGIIMNEEIRGYTNENLDKDYSGLFIILPKGAMIAETEKYEITIFRDPNEAAESICRFMSGDRYAYAFEENYIVISLPKVVFENYNSLRRKECGQIFTSMFVVPVLQQVIQSFWIETSEEIPYKWYYVLDGKIHDLIGDSIEGFSAYDIAMKIIEDMMFESSSYLSKYYGDINEY
ncbi:MAG: hypothetical protein KRP56_03785 [Candidatus Methanogranum gryphiswaldense]|nr:MAG: hypothetical protein KRP56_03785 [Candidatus Methanogranum sp. U3.2.1]